MVQTPNGRMRLVARKRDASTRCLYIGGVRVGQARKLLRGWWGEIRADSVYVTFRARYWREMLPALADGYNRAAGVAKETS